MVLLLFPSGSDSFPRFPFQLRPSTYLHTSKNSPAPWPQQPGWLCRLQLGKILPCMREIFLKSLDVIIICYMPECSHFSRSALLLSETTSHHKFLNFRQTFEDIRQYDGNYDRARQSAIEFRIPQVEPLRHRVALAKLASIKGQRRHNVKPINQL